MHKATKIFLIAVAVIVVIFAGWYGLETYGFNHPKLTVYFLTGEADGASFTVPQIEFEERSSWGASELWDGRFYEAYDVIDQMIFFAQSHSAPYEFDSRVEIVDGKTVFTIEGWYTLHDHGDGEHTDHGDERLEDSLTLTLDYVLTKNIEEH